MSLSASSALRRSSAELLVPADCSAASVFCMPSVTATPSRCPSQCRDPPHGDPVARHARSVHKQGGESACGSARAAGALLRRLLLRGRLRRGLALARRTLLAGRLLLGGARLSLLGCVLRSRRGRLSVARRGLVGGRHGRTRRWASALPVAARLPLRLLPVREPAVVDRVGRGGGGPRGAVLGRSAVAQVVLALACLHRVVRRGARSRVAAGYVEMLGPPPEG